MICLPSDVNEMDRTPALGPLKGPKDHLTRLGIPNTNGMVRQAQNRVAGFHIPNANALVTGTRNNTFAIR